MGDNPYPAIPPLIIRQDGVTKLLQKLNPHKASGPDNISTMLLKETAHELSPAVSLLFRASLHQGVIPLDWRKANIVPIFKKGDRAQAENYRPISLTSVLCKTLEHILHSHIIKHLHASNILCPEQHGFRKRRSCETQLIITVNDLAKALDDGKQTDCILLDFSKAFDTVPHKRLLHKLHHYGVRGNVLAWIRSFLTGRTQKVLVNGKESKETAVLSGVPQGTVLGPLLFLAFINDLPAVVSSKVKLFADDSLLYRPIENVHDAELLQQDLDHLQDWERTWLMSFNPDKCEVLRVTNKRKVIKHDYVIHGHRLLPAIDHIPKSQQKKQRQLAESEKRDLPNTAKYLGVYLNSKLSWNHHVDAVTKKANSTLSFLSRNLSSCPRHVKSYCYQSYVRPTLEYSSSVWSPATQRNIGKVESVQRRAARFVFSDYSRDSSPTSMVQDLKWQTLQQRRDHSKLAMMYQITHDLIDIPFDEHLAWAKSSRPHPLQLRQPFCRLAAYSNSFFPDAIRQWNAAPHCIVDAPSLGSLKHQLTKLQ